MVGNIENKLIPNGENDVHVQYYISHVTHLDHQFCQFGTKGKKTERNKEEQLICSKFICHNKQLMYHNINVLSNCFYTYYVGCGFEKERKNFLCFLQYVQFVIVKIALQ